MLLNNLMLHRELLLGNTAEPHCLQSVQGLSDGAVGIGGAYGTHGLLLNGMTFHSDPENLNNIMT